MQKFAPRVRRVFGRRKIKLDGNTILFELTAKGLRFRHRYCCEWRLLSFRDLARIRKDDEMV